MGIQTHEVTLVWPGGGSSKKTKRDSPPPKRSRFKSRPKSLKTASRFQGKSHRGNERIGENTQKTPSDSREEPRAAITDGEGLAAVGFRRNSYDR